MAMGFQKNAGFLVLAIWLILHGLVGVTNIALPLAALPALALIAGVLILVGR